MVWLAFYKLFNVKPETVGDPTSKGSLTLEFTLLLGLDMIDILP